MFILPTTITVPICLHSDLSERWIILHHSSALLQTLFYHTKSHIFTMVQSLEKLTSGSSDFVSYLLFGKPSLKVHQPHWFPCSLFNTQVQTHIKVFAFAVSPRGNFLPQHNWPVPKFYSIFCLNFASPHRHLHSDHPKTALLAPYPFTLFIFLQCIYY